MRTNQDDNSNPFTGNSELTGALPPSSETQEPLRQRHASLFNDAISIRKTFVRIMLRKPLSETQEPHRQCLVHGCYALTSILTLSINVSGTILLLLTTSFDLAELAGFLLVTSAIVFNVGMRLSLELSNIRRLPLAQRLREDSAARKVLFLLSPGVTLILATMFMTIFLSIKIAYSTSWVEIAFAAFLPLSGFTFVGAIYPSLVFIRLKMTPPPPENNSQPDTEESLLEEGVVTSNPGYGGV